jgi:hypothetical protein
MMHSYQHGGEAKQQYKQIGQFETQPFLAFYNSQQNSDNRQ